MTNIAALRIRQMLGYLVEFRQPERAVWVCGSFCLPLVLLLSVVITLNGFVARDKYIVFLALLGVVPALSAFIFSPPRLLAWLTSESALEKFLCFNLSAVLLVTPWLAFSDFTTPLKSRFWYIVAIGYISGAMLVVINIFYSRGTPSKHPLDLLNKILVVVTPLAFVAATVTRAQWLGGFSHTFAAAGTFVAAASYSAWYLNVNPCAGKRQQRVIFAVTTIVPVIAAVAMCDVQLDYDALHYTAYLAPATAVHAGRIPLIDVFCQYGQSYLLYYLAFSMLPPTYHAAALVTAITNVIYTVCFIAILRKAIRNHIVFLMLGTLLPVTVWLNYFFCINGTPSLGGMRYLPVVLLGASLVWTERGVLFSKGTILGVVFCWFWSLEAALYGTFVYCAFAAATCASSGRLFREMLFSFFVFLMRLLALLLSFGAGTIALYLVITGKIPRYDLYLDLVLAYVGPNPFMEYNFFQQGFYAWAPILSAFFVVPCWIVRAYVSGSISNRLPEIAVVWALAVVLSVYCLVSTQPIYIKTAILSLFVMLFVVIDLALNVRPRNNNIMISHIALAPVFVLLISLVSGSAGANFLIPPAYGSASTSMLAEIFFYRKIVPSDFFQRIGELCHSEMSFDVGNVCLDQPNMAPVHFKEAVDLVKKWQGELPTIFIFCPADALIEAALTKPHRLPLTFSYVDGFSPALFKYLLARSEPVISQTLKDGDSIILSRDLLSLNELQWALLNMMTKYWRFRKVEQTEYFNVYRLEKDLSLNSDLILPSRPIKGRNSL